jgi:beta-lactamase class D
MQIKILLLIQFILGTQQVLSARNFTAKDTAKVQWDTLRMKEMSEWGTHFNAAGAKGTLIIFDQKKNRYHIYNKERFHERFIPASTFKIFNSLVALETKVIKNEKEILDWDGFTRGNVNWDQSQNMKSAFKNSTLWFYQELARRIGFTRMEEYITKAVYGNRDISGGIDQFWINGKLRISAWEQIDMLKKLQADLLPFSKETMATVKELMIEEKLDDKILRAKTGWSTATNPCLGWYVGYVQKNNPKDEEEQFYYYFALNMDIDNAGKAENRKLIVKKVLVELKIW